ncbi:MAG: excisionase family DNA-binding protein [Oligoflexia bacterium]|nr:excisionase family DNA-binding protein [Oligoflexia bacterium]
MTGTSSRRSPSAVYYTTHQVAKLLGVSLATVVNWAKKGRIDAHRTPGGHRRISRDSLLKFCRDFDYPVPPELRAFALAAAPTTASLLIVHGDHAFAELLRDYLVLDDDVSVGITDRALEVGFLLASQPPQVLLLDLELSGVRATQLSELAHRLDPVPLIVGCVTLDSAEADELVADQTLVGVLTRTTPVADLARRLRAMLPV